MATIVSASVHPGRPRRFCCCWYVCGRTTHWPKRLFLRNPEPLSPRMVRATSSALPCVSCFTPPISTSRHSSIPIPDGIRTATAPAGCTISSMLVFKWWVYSEAGTYSGNVEIRNSDTPTPVVVVPRDAAGRTIHVICEVSDNAEYHITRYRRVVLTADER
jgi:hypothetical protein